MKVRASQQTSYRVRLDRVVDYIYDHLEEDITNDRLAEVACLSPFHWHRIYTAMRGETITATVRRLRLQRAADRLANSSTPIKEIAELAGYGSVEAFGRAFKAAYEMPPGEYRAQGSHAKFKAATALNDEQGFPVKIVELPPVHSASVKHAGSYMRIDQAMTKLFAGLAEQGLLSNESRMLGVFLDDPDLVAEVELRSMACSPVSDQTKLSSPLESMTLRGGPYARLRYQGPYADMKDAYRWLYGVWLPASGREAADSPAFEAYLNNPDEVAPTELLTDINLPLEE